MSSITSFVDYVFSLFGLSGSPFRGNDSLQYFQGRNQLSGRMISSPIHSTGNFDVSDCQLQSISSLGKLILSESFVQGNCLSRGKLEARNCPQIGKIHSCGETFLSGCSNIGGILSSGEFSLEDSHVRGDVVISGDVANITNSTLDGVLNTADQTIRISNSSVGKIIVQPVYQTEKHESISGISKITRTVMPQTIELRGPKTQVGEVIFEDGAIGTVYLKDQAQIGNVVGGRVIR
jgi:hypothetical protein